ncbi:hypothetical protein PHMEG_0007636 [Phytophthora megakarya]|uniref:Uncharacterized protein n=1 Tax=Phytophthora megakarya TaxID=4795 RepID=A0A225WKP9_9STRA|nr:hypothetical protein PHMEG_0007636 [Phytophthora megakarya]
MLRNERLVETSPEKATVEYKRRALVEHIIRILGRFWRGKRT